MRKRLTKPAQPESNRRNERKSKKRLRERESMRKREGQREQNVESIFKKLSTTLYVHSLYIQCAQQHYLYKS